jgi:hypothetical protein
VPGDPTQIPPDMGAVPSPMLGLDAPTYDPAQDHVVHHLESLTPLDLTIHLSKEDEDHLARIICDEISAYEAAVSRRFWNLDTWRRSYELLPPGTANRWENSSDIPSLLTRLYCNSHHTRLNQQILNAVPPFTAVARKPEAKDVTSLIEDAMTAVLDQADWNSVADDLHRELVIAGNVFLRIGYREKWARLPQRQVEHDEDTAHSLLLAGVEPEEAMYHSVRRTKFGHVDQKIYDGVEFKVIPFEDGVICPANVRDPEEALGIGERLRLRGADLLDGVERGWYFADAVDDLLEKTSDPEPQARVRRKDEQGLQPQTGGAVYHQREDRLYREYDVYELCWQYDADDDGKLEWIVVHLHRETRKILGLRWMDYEHGRPYYMLERYVRRTAELFGMGIPEMIACYQDADTSVACALQDHSDLSLNIGGNFAYTSLSGYDPTKSPLRLGQPLKFESLSDNDFRQLTPPTPPTELYQQTERYRTMCDLLTASSNPTLGRQTETNKTLGEVQIVTNAATQIFEDFASRVARDHAKVWDHARWLTAQYGIQSDDGGIMYRRTAAPNVVEFQTIQPEELSADVDLVPTGMTQLSDQGARIQQSTLIQAQLMQLILSVQQWLPFADVVLESFGQYMKDLKWPLRDKVLMMLRAEVQQLQMQQQLAAAAQQALMAGGIGAPVAPGAGPGGGVPPAPAGTIGGPPSPIEGPPALPPGATAVNAFPPAQAAL